MGAEYTYINCKTALSPSRLPGLNYSLNPYVGCEHGCAYCYSPSVLRDPELAVSWGRAVRVKQNIAEVLAKEVTRKPKGVVGMSTVTDPYQPIEAKLELTRKCLELLSKHDFPISIQTKSSLVLRDIDLVIPGKTEVGVTITTMDRRIAALIEPGASPPEARARILDDLSSRGVTTWLFLGPIIPELNDSSESLRRVIEVAARTKSKIIYDKLNLKWLVMGRLGPVLESERPGLAMRLPGMVNADSQRWLEVKSEIAKICKQLEVKCESAFPEKISSP